MTNCNFYIYIMGSKSGTLYIGVTNSLERRVSEHKHGLIEGFSKKYGCNKLVYLEHVPDIDAAIVREKQLKNWRREKKEALIRKANPTWKDLSLSWR